jgi:protein O-mannosyl-transferase
LAALRLRGGEYIALLIVAPAIATAAAYSAACEAPFVFDDAMGAQQNATIRHPWPPSVPLQPASNTAVSGRPVVNYTLGMNCRISELLGVDQRADPERQQKTVGYHVVNLLLHLICGALLFGVVQTIFRCGRVPGGWESSGDAIAGVVTAIRLVHPIQGAAIDRVVQRTEFVVCCCYIGTLYASFRAWDAATSREKLQRYAVALFVCLLDIRSMEAMMTAPLIGCFTIEPFGPRAGANWWPHLAAAVRSTPC